MKTWTGALCAALYMTVSATVCSTAAAQPGDRRAEARARANEGLTLHKHGDDAGALLKFQQAYALVPLPELLFDLSLAEQRTGHLLEAQAGYRKCAADPAFAAHAADARQHLEELRGQLGHLAIEAPPGTALTIDGQPVTDWSVPIDVLPGPHSVAATNGWQVTRSVDAAAGKEIVVSLGPASGAATPAPAATTPPPAAAAPPASTGAGDVTAPPATSSSSSSAKLIVAGSLAGLAVVAVGVGVVFGLESVGKGNDASTLNGQRGAAPCPAAGASLCQNLSNDYSAQKTDATIAGALYVTGGVLAVGAVATWLLWPRSTTTTSGAWVVPSVGPQWAGVAGGGRF